MKRFTSAFLAACILFFALLFAFADSESVKDTDLKFNDGKFTILHITDPQDDHHPAYDMTNFVRLAISRTNPDLVVFTGDIVEDKRGADTGIDDEDTREGVCVYDVDGKIIYDQTLANTKVAADAVLSIINDAEIPFVIAQGNNDHICGITNEDWLKIFSEYEYCLTKDMSSDDLDRIDFNTEIKNNNGKTIFNIWCFDTGTKGVDKQQIDWYVQKSNELKSANDGKPVPSFVFQHIYTSDIGNLFERCNAWDDGAIVNGIGFYRLNRDKATGHYEDVIKPGKKSNQFKAWKSQGDVLGVYFGHEHYEGYTGKVDGIELGFTYGCEFAKSGPYGYRVFTLYEDDIEKYDNDLYVYTGSVLTNNADFVLQQDEAYPVYETKAQQRAAYLENFKVNIIKWFKELFD